VNPGIVIRLRLWDRIRNNRKRSYFMISNPPAFARSPGDPLLVVFDVQCCADGLAMFRVSALQGCDVRQSADRALSPIANSPPGRAPQVEKDTRRLPNDRFAPHGALPARIA
jgi:hypothetical protein